MRGPLVACTLLALCCLAPHLHGSPVGQDHDRHLWHQRLHLSPKKYDLERLREPVYSEVRPAFVKRRRRSPEPESLEEEAAAASIAASVASLPSKSGRSHQFITAREQKSAHERPVLHELAGESPSPSSPPSVAVPGPPRDGPTDIRGAGDIDTSTSRLGSGREALGVRANEIPQGPGFSAVYEAESMRHASDHRHFLANAYGGQYGYSHHLSSYPPPPPPPPPPSSALMGRNPGPTASSTAQPRRIIYYASLPEPVAQSMPHPSYYPSAATQAGIGARTPHEYRGPYDAGAGAGAGVTSGRNAGGLSPSLYAFSTSAYPEPPYQPAPSNLPVTLAAASQQDYSRYRAPNNLPRYHILDAEPPQPYAPYRSPPAPMFPHPYRSSSAFSGASALGSTSGPETREPLRYSPYDYNGVGARTANSAALMDPYRSPSASAMTNPVSPVLPGPPFPADDLYRGYNPRQPAPWSMQVRANLTVKDDGYGSVGLPPAARRFYVTSQQPPYPQAISAAEARQRYLP